MNKPIRRLFVLVVVMFALLIGATSRWTVFDATSLQNNSLNRRALLESEYVKRGVIYAAGQTTVLATSIRKSNGTYERKYPLGSLFAAPLGFAFTDLGASGLEAYDNSLLAGKPVQQSSIIDQLEGKRSGGDSVYTTLNPKAQQVAVNALGTLHGAVVAFVPSTGAIRVLATSPTYNPNLIDRKSYRESLAKEPAIDGPLVDRAVAAEDQPGSAFKVVTAIAAIDSHEYTPASVLSGASPQTFEGTVLHNDGNTSYGDITLTQALTFSVNTVWAQVAEHLGGALLGKYMNRLGFGRLPPIDLPATELEASGVRGDETNDDNQLLAPTDDRVDVPLLGIGEGELDVTPLQMAMVAGAVANHGILMRPYLTNYITNADGVVVQRTKPQVYSHVMSAATAEQVGTMMASVVSDGTAETALKGFIPVAGKTGTAELSTTSPYSDLWFIAYAPINNPQIAVAVDVEDTIGFGGTVAAPIARQVIQALLNTHG